MFAGTAAVAFVVPMAVVGLGGAAGSATPSNDNTNGVLKYGFDINDEFTNFDPATSVNDCGYTVMSNIYQSVTAPGQTAISGGVAQSWTVSNNSSTVTLHLRPNMVFSNGAAGDVDRRHGQLCSTRRRARCAARSPPSRR